MSISLKNIKVKTRLWLSFSLLASFIIMMGMMTVITFNQVATITIQLYKHPLAVGRAIREVRGDLHKGRTLILKSVLLPDSTTLESNIAELETLQKDIDKNMRVIRERFLGDMGDVEKLSQEFIKLQKLREGVFDLIRVGDKEQAIQQVIDGTNAQQVVEMEKLIDRIMNFGNEKAALFIEDVTATVKNTQWWVSGIILISIVLTIWVIMNTTRTISRSLERALNIAHAIGSGDFSNRMDEIITQSEIGQL
jgi:methyl-accepting chemotaxis protein